MSSFSLQIVCSTPSSPEWKNKESLCFILKKKKKTEAHNDQTVLDHVPERLQGHVCDQEKELY